MELFEKLKHLPVKQIDEALYAIGESPNPDSLEIVLPFLTHDNPEVRETAAYVLGEIKDANSVGPLLELIDTEPNDAVLVYAFYALRNYRDPLIEKMLLAKSQPEVFDTLTKKIRHRIVESFEDYPSEAARKSLVRMLAKYMDDRTISMHCVDALILMNDSELMDTWKSVLENESSEYAKIIALRGQMEIEFSQGKIQSREALDFEIQEDLTTLLNIFNFTLALNKTKEESLLSLIFEENISSILSIGAIKMPIFLSMMLIEKGSSEIILELRNKVRANWSAEKKEDLESMIGNHPQYARYFN